MIDTASVVALVESFGAPASTPARTCVAETLRFLRGTSQPTSRTNYQPGHLTASGVVLSPERDRVLLVYHRRLQRWLQPGGHVEVWDADLPGAARREVEEETCVAVDPGVRPTLVGVDVHAIPAARGEPEHLHFDLVFRFVALDGHEVTPDALRTAWCPADALDEFGADEALARAVQRARHGPESRRRVIPVSR